jgi:MSHA biogenesis protein MshI
MLTISANEELFFTRRLDLPSGFLGMNWSGHAGMGEAPAPDAYTPVAEYVPEYARSDLAAGSDFMGGATSDSGDSDRVQRFVVEVQRSLDLWDRTWSSMPLSGLRVYAGERSGELATWLGREVGQSVTAMDVAARFPGWEAAAAADQLYCLPLLGVLLRTETRKL